MRNSTVGQWAPRVAIGPAGLRGAARATDGRTFQPTPISATIFVTIGGALSLPYLIIIGGGAGLMRMLFPIYALAIALTLVSWRRSVLLSFAVGLFAFTPFLRRVIDFRIGFEAFNPILLAPYFALLPTLPALLRRIMGRRDGLVWPFALICSCIIYAAFLALLSMRLTSAVYESLRWLLPVSLCAFILDKPEQMEPMRRSLCISLLVVLPILAVYGIGQYMRPPLWDTFWLTNTHVTSFGLPVPYEIRVFSMMNSPGSVAAFAVSAMILLFAEGTLGFAVAAMGVSLVALTIVRAAWLMCAVSTIVLILQASASQKFKLILGVAVVIFGGSVLIGSHALPPEVVNRLTERFATFSDVHSGNDASAEARVATYDTLFSRLGKSPLGEGFGATSSIAATAEKRDLPPLDSGVLESTLTLGIPMGSVYFVTMGALAFIAYRASRLDRRRFSAYSALLIGNIATLPVSNSLIGEGSILTWAAIGFLLANAELAAVRQQRQIAWLRGRARAAAGIADETRRSGRTSSTDIVHGGDNRDGMVGRPVPL